ncbi:MAG: methionyl-tRNA formyltransferase [Alphaproteobacteria bacterium]|nr:methionyl-tRNA formyltransferase [Alphaproteobacteria bacterium]
MKLVLMGTSAWVIPIFECALTEHEIVAVFTRGPKPVGRKKIITQSPVHEWAAARGIPVHNKISDFKFLISDLPERNHKPEITNQKYIDCIVVASYGVILKDYVLDFAPCINIHPSDLPKYRGPAPMSTAIYNGDAESAICLMQVAAEVDAGEVYMRKKFEIGENETTGDVETRVGEMARDMLSEFLAAPEKFPGVSQVGEPTFTRKWNSADEIIDWSIGAAAIHNQVRSIGGRTRINGLDVKILETRICPPTDTLCASTPPRGGVVIPGLEILRVQPAGKNPMDWKSFVNGQRGKPISLGD